MQVSYITGGKYCRRCEYYFITQKLFCECCGMRLRSSPANREYKEKFRAKRKPVDSVDISIIDLSAALSNRPEDS
jgi:hypothetical protein